MVARSSSYSRDVKNKERYEKHDVCPQRVFAAVAISLLLLALTTNYNASAQTVLTPPITLFQTFPTSNNQLQVAISLDSILDQEIVTGQSTLISTPTGLILTAPIGTLPLFVLTQLDQELGPTFPIRRSLIRPSAER
jgi:hypothetical protein